jgi:adenylate kinase
MRVRRNNASAIVLLGLPGSGKGTQARLLAQALSLPVLSTGDMLRQEVGARTRLGQTVEALMNQGLLVSDDLVNKVVCSRIQRNDCANGFILDGYPRTVAQAQFLDSCVAEQGFEPTTVAYLDVPPSVVEARMLSRLHCPSCGRTYGVEQSRLSICVADGTTLIHRGDDNSDVIRERLRQYTVNTAPLLNYYDGDHLHRISAEGTPSEVSELLMVALQTKSFTAGTLPHVPYTRPLL